MLPKGKNLKKEKAIFSKFFRDKAVRAAVSQNRNVLAIVLTRLTDRSVSLLEPSRACLGAMRRFKDSSNSTKMFKSLNSKNSNKLFIPIKDFRDKVTACRVVSRVRGLEFKADFRVRDKAGL